MIVMQTDIKEFPCKHGKVRDIYDIGDDRLVIVSTDRISAFDKILPNGIPDKGKLLTGLTCFWLRWLFRWFRPASPERFIFNHHLLTDNVEDMPAPFRDQPEIFAGRTMMVRKCDVIPVECIVRGYLCGSGYKDYVRTGQLCGQNLPKGLKENMPLVKPMFTPSTKAPEGQHDQNITIDEAKELVDRCCHDRRRRSRADLVESLSLLVYQQAAEYAWHRGIIIADTKFEWGISKKNGSLMLIDEVLTSDSSRYWPIDGYCVGESLVSHDKQFVRDYLTGTGWDKNSPPPELPEYVVQETAAKYRELYSQLW